jgi:hypothetical protein
MKENTMDKRKILDKRFEAIALGTGFVWIGILSLIPGNQNSIGVLGIGLILLGLNLARSLSQIPTNVFTIVLGSLASVLGLAALLRPVLNFPRIELDFFPLLLIVIGLYFLIPSTKNG